MTMLAEDYDYVIGGDPDRDTIDLAVLDSATGGVRAHPRLPRADRRRIRRQVSSGRANMHLVVGSGRWKGRGASPLVCLTALAQAGEDVVEALAVSDALAAPKATGLDAVRAARTALGPWSSSQVRAPRDSRSAIRALTATRHVGYCQPHQGNQRTQEPHRRRA